MRFVLRILDRRMFFNFMISLVCFSTVLDMLDIFGETSFRFFSTEVVNLFFRGGVFDKDADVFGTGVHVDGGDGGETLIVFGFFSGEVVFNFFVEGGLFGIGAEVYGAGGGLAGETPIVFGPSLWNGTLLTSGITN